MNGDMIALAVGTVLAVATLAFVLYPLFFASEPRRRGSRPAVPAPDASAILALREIEFDRATGKLSESDYAELRASYADRALRELREAKADTSALPQDSIEARIREYRLTHRECPTCGIRPETDAAYCSHCGSYLDSVCPDCSASITEPGAQYCSTCGGTLTGAVVLNRS
jgi:hypothetical protein